MHRRLSAEIIASGTELLLGDTIDTNSAYIAQQLRDLGVDVYFHTTVGDNARRAADIIETGVNSARKTITDMVDQRQWNREEIMARIVPELDAALGKRV